jgi:hypothetical protein
MDQIRLSVAKIKEDEDHAVNRAERRRLFGQIIS